MAIKKKEKWGIPTGRLLDSGCFHIEIRKLSNHPVNLPGDDSMTRYKITYKGSIWQLIDMGDGLRLKWVAFVEEKKKKRR
jgi:hypothetical protein